MPFKDPANMWILMLSIEHGLDIHLLKHSLHDTKHACEVLANSLRDLYGSGIGIECTKEYDV